MANCSIVDCLMAPIPSKCFFYCIYQILAKATPDQKRNVLKISSSTADAIFYAFNTYHPSDFQDLAQHLQPMQIEETIRTFRTITQKQLDHFIWEGK